MSSINREPFSLCSSSVDTKAIPNMTLYVRVASIGFTLWHILSRKWWCSCNGLVFFPTRAGKWIYCTNNYQIQSNPLNINIGAWAHIWPWNVKDNAMSNEIPSLISVPLSGQVGVLVVLVPGISLPLSSTHQQNVEWHCMAWYCPVTLHLGTYASPR